MTAGFEFRPSLPVLILQRADGDFQHGVLGIVRSLGRRGIRVYLVHQDAATPAAASRHCDGVVHCPTGAPDDVVMERLLEFGRRQGPAILIPTDDESALLVEARAADLRACFRFPEQPDGLAATLSDKVEMARLCAEHDIPTPWTHGIRDRRDLVALSGEVTYPVALKSIDGARTFRRTGQRIVTVRRGGHRRGRCGGVIGGGHDSEHGRTPTGRAGSAGDGCVADLCGPQWRVKVRAEPKLAAPSAASPLLCPTMPGPRSTGTCQPSPPSRRHRSRTRRWIARATSCACVPSARGPATRAAPGPVPLPAVQGRQPARHPQPTIRLRSGLEPATYRPAPETISFRRSGGSRFHRPADIIPAKQVDPDGDINIHPRTGPCATTEKGWSNPCPLSAHSASVRWVPLQCCRWWRRSPPDADPARRQAHRPRLPPRHRPRLPPRHRRRCRCRQRRVR